jgi:acyl-CoA thioester hydrolase
MTDPAGARGAIRGDTHVMPVRVYWEDTDAGAIVYYANYLKFTERARSDMLRLLGIDQRAMMEQDSGAMFAVRDVTASYLAPARLDDDLVVETRLTEMKGATLSLSQNVMRQDEMLVQTLVRAAFIGLDGRPRRIPALVRDRLTALKTRGGEEDQ